MHRVGNHRQLCETSESSCVVNVECLGAVLTHVSNLKMQRHKTSVLVVLVESIGLAATAGSSLIERHVSSARGWHFLATSGN